MSSREKSRARQDDCFAGNEEFLDDVLQGLLKKNKSVPSKYFYDYRGAQLFDQICQLEEYYPTRTEIAIMQEHASGIAACLGEDCLIIEYGSGTSEKTGYLLNHLKEPAGYVPVDICEDSLADASHQLNQNHPDLRIEPVCTDFTKPFALPDFVAASHRKVIYFPGSTLGNFDHESARELLENIAASCQEDGGLMIGLDMKKDTKVLEAAYNDKQGVTREFNLNLLRRMNSDLGADFHLDQFEHRATYNAPEGRIEMHLVSRRDQVVHFNSHKIVFQKGESILTEYSHKYDHDGFAQLAASAGLQVEQVWTDPQEYFSVQYLTPIQSQAQGKEPSLPTLPSKKRSSSSGKIANNKRRCNP